MCGYFNMFNEISLESIQVFKFFSYQTSIAKVEAQEKMQLAKLFV